MITTIITSIIIVMLALAILGLIIIVAGVNSIDDGGKDE